MSEPLCSDCGHPRSAHYEDEIGNGATGTWFVCEVCTGGCILTAQELDETTGPIPGGEWHDLIINLTKRLGEAQKEIEADDALLAEYQRMLDMIPACPLHGSSCVPHARDWVLGKIAQEPPTELVVFS